MLRGQSRGGTADKLKAILSQEQSHAEIDWRLLKDTEEAEAKFQKEYEESKIKMELERQKGIISKAGGVEQYAFAGRAATTAMAARRLKRRF